MAVSLNTAQITGYLRQNYPGFSYDPNFVQTVMNNSQGGNPDYIAGAIESSPQYQQYSIGTAQAAYKQAQGSAISTLQGQQGSINLQYNQLLNDTLGLGTVAMNTATSAEEKQLASRGILGPSAGTSLSAAQLAVQQNNQAAVGTLGYTQSQIMNQLAQQIAGIQSGAAGTELQYPLQAGSLALAGSIAQAQIAQGLAQAQATTLQAPYVAVPGYGVVNIKTGQLVGNYAQSPVSSAGYKINSIGFAASNP